MRSRSSSERKSRKRSRGGSGGGESEGRQGRGVGGVGGGKGDVNEKAGSANQQRKGEKNIMCMTNLKYDISPSIPSQHSSILYRGKIS